MKSTADRTEIDLKRFERVPAPARAQALAILRTAIQNGYFESGQRLKERELLTMTGSSRTTLRETLRQLESEGLVEVVPGKGPVVSTLTVEQAKQVYEVREALEALAAELFVKNATDEEVAAIEALLLEIEAASVDGNMQEILALKGRFYAQLFAAARNEYLRTVIESLHGRIWQLRRLSLSLPGRPIESLEEIRALVAALVRRDSEAASQTAKIHIRGAMPAAMAQLKGLSGD